MTRLQNQDNPMINSIDLHAHIFVPEAETLAREHPRWNRVEEATRQVLGEHSYQINNEQATKTLSKSKEISLRLEDMDRMGVNIQVLSPSPTQYYLWAEPDLASTLVQIQNKRIAEVCAAYPDRFFGIGAVALQHSELAVSQLDKCMNTYHMKGVEIASTYGGMDLSNGQFEPFWELAEKLKAVILIHPLGSTLGERTVPYYLSNIIGMPLDTTLALSHLIFSGVFDRYPHLKVCAVHGGGYFPAYIGRFDHGYRTRPESGTMKHPPSEYLRRIYFDTVVFRPDILQGLINRAGIGQVVVGTDYPFDMGDYDFDALLGRVPGLDDKGLQAIRSGNARRLLNL
jgi:aminocarboxymuconate-semialdehyde decarboxylase